MKQTNLYVVTLFLTLHVVLVVFLGVPCSCVDEYYELCVTQRCLAGPNISYPFRIPTDTNSYCGYPGFELNCSSFGYPLFRLQDQDYVVEDISYESNTVRLVNVDFYSPRNGCFPEIKNYSLVTSLLRHDKTYSYLHFLSDCNMSAVAMVSDIERYEIGCRGGNSGLVMLGKDENLDKALEECKMNVIAPVEDGGFDEKNVKDEYEDVMKNGFELSWLVSDCRECRASGGRCGYNVSSYHFECFCTDRPHSATCKPKGEGRHQSYCPKDFVCGNSGNMSFPFYNTTDSSCGLCLVDCHDTNPLINLWPKEYVEPKLWLHIIKPSMNKVQIEVQKSCLAFRDYLLPGNEYGSFSITSKLTPLLKCNSSSYDIKVSYDPPTSWNFSNCEVDGFTIFYNYSNERISDYNGQPPPNCSIIRLPLENRSFNLDEDLYDILSEDISLEWSVTRPWPCYDCFSHDQHCIVDLDNNIHSNFHCLNEGNSKKIGLILGSVIGGIVFILMICGIVFIIWLRKKRNKDGKYLLSRNVSSDPSSKADIEVGSVRFGVPVYTYAELEKATASFDSANELGDGGFGIVYFGKLKDGREVAVKRLYEHNYKRMEHFMNEINILTSLRHPNLVSLYGCTSRRSRELLLVYEYVPNGTVADHIHGNKAEERLLTWPIRMNIALETANALAYLHNSEIIHRDVKTNNILLDHNFSVKVADFGLSRLFPLDATHVSTAPQGTPGYVDPEYHECYQLTDKSDVYSFGVVLIELISSLPAVDISRHRHEINLSNLALSRIQRNALDELVDSSLGYGSDPEVTRMTGSIAELAYRCLQIEKEMRPSMDEVVEILHAINEGADDSEPKEVSEVNDNVGDQKGVLVPPSPESDEIVLLKNMKLPPSPISVTERWVSGSSSASV